jgi:hypothetical protein
MVRGIEGRAIFLDDFLSRLNAVAIAKTLALFAWALVPNHLHLVVRTGATPLARAMRSLLINSVGAFNRRPGVRPPSIHKAAQRGRADRASWDRVLNDVMTGTG